MNASNTSVPRTVSLGIPNCDSAERLFLLESLEGCPLMRISPSAFPPRLPPPMRVKVFSELKKARSNRGTAVPPADLSIHESFGRDPGADRRGGMESRLPLGYA